MIGAERVRNLVRASLHKEAEALLTLLLAENPEDAELSTELGLLYCYTQREFEALDLLKKSVGSSRSHELSQTLSDYFHGRSLMASKLGVADAKGRDALAALTLAPRSNVGIKLSACLIVKDEEKQLDRCLASITPLCDEIVIVDTGSTDRTVEIADKYGAKIGHFEWCDDFAAARNASLEMATGDWVLCIDADEELTKDSHNSIREALIRHHFGGFYVRIVNLMADDVEANQYVHTPVRLFRNIPEIRFAGRIHEQVLQDLDNHGFLAATLSNATLRHYGYQPAVLAEKDKLNRTITMLERETREHPRDAFHWFNLANAYSLGRRSHEAEITARTCINFIPDKARYAPVAYQILTSALIAQDRADEALQECQVAEMKGILTVTNEFDRAHALLKLNRPQEALDSITKCQAMEWPSDLTGDFAIKSYKGVVLKSQCLTRLGRHEEGLELADEALTVDPGFGIAHYARALALEKLNRPMDAGFAYVAASKQPGLEACRRLAARMFALAGDPAKAAIWFEALLNENPQDSDAASGFLKSIEQLGDDDRLAVAYRQVAQSGLITAPLLTNWGTTLARLGKAEDALKAYEAATQADPTYQNAFLNAGDLLYSCGHYAQAAGQYEAALRLDALNAQAWFVLGNCFERMAHDHDARLAYHHALSIDPFHREAKSSLNRVAQAA